MKDNVKVVSSSLAGYLIRQFLHSPPSHQHTLHLDNDRPDEDWNADNLVITELQMDPAIGRLSEFWRYRILVTLGAGDKISFNRRS